MSILKGPLAGRVRMVLPPGSVAGRLASGGVVPIPFEDLGQLLPAGGGGAAPSFPLSPVSAVLGSGTPGQFERHPALPSVVRLSDAVYFGPDRAGPIVLPGFSTENGAYEAASSVASGVLSVSSVDADLTGHLPGRAIVLPADIGTGGAWPALREFVVGLSMGDLNESGVFWTFCRADGANLLFMDLCRTSNVWRVRTLFGPSTWQFIDAGILAEAQANSRVWLRVRVGPGGSWQTDVNPYDPALCPSGWIALTSNRTAGFDVLADPIHSFRLAGYNSGSNPHVVEYAVGELRGVLGFPVSPASLLLADVDAGVGKTFSPAEAPLRLALADAANGLRGDSADWTFSCVSGASPAPAAGSYHPAAEVVSPSPARYVRLYAHCASPGGAHPGSLDTSLVRLSSS